MDQQVYSELLKYVQTKNDNLVTCPSWVQNKQTAHNRFNAKYRNYDWDNNTGCLCVWRHFRQKSGKEKVWKRIINKDEREELINSRHVRTHDNRFHRSLYETFYAISKDCYWRGMFKDIKTYCIVYRRVPYVVSPKCSTRGTRLGPLAHF